MATKEVLIKKAEDAQVIYDYLADLLNINPKLPVTFIADETKEKIKVLSNTLINLYEASKPEIFEKGWENEKFAPIMYLIGLMNNQIDDEKGCE